MDGTACLMSSGSFLASLPLGTVGRGSTSAQVQWEGVNESGAMFKATIGWREAVRKG